MEIFYLEKQNVSHALKTKCSVHSWLKTMYRCFYLAMVQMSV